MILYLDTSVVLCYLLNQPPQLTGWGDWDAAYTSEVTGMEARRAFDRLHLDGKLDDVNLARAHEELSLVESVLGRIALNRAVLHRASLPMPIAVRTLDAIHLASAMLFQEQRCASLIFATRDGRQATAARALGFEVRM